MLTCAGVISAGKSTLTQILADELGTKPFFEPVDDNPVLPLFYRGNQLVEEGKAQTNPYTFLLQVYFLNRRFAMIKKAMQEDNNILDRSIYEDSIFMKMNTDQGHATQEEWEIYQSLLKNMLEELPYAAHKKSPDLMIFVDVNLETMLARVKKRGRPFEQVENDPSLLSYYKTLIEYYAQWQKTYNASALLTIDGNKYDFAGNADDRNSVLDQIESAMVDVGTLSPGKFEELKEKRYNK
nr:deoxynucleoside kinase [Aeriscardovia aeriphila]